MQRRSDYGCRRIRKGLTYQTTLNAHGDAYFTVFRQKLKRGDALLPLGHATEYVPSHEIEKAKRWADRRIHAEEDFLWGQSVIQADEDSRKNLP